MGFYPITGDTAAGSQTAASRTEPPRPMRVVSTPSTVAQFRGIRPRDRLHRLHRLLVNLFHERQRIAQCRLDAQLSQRRRIATELLLRIITEQPLLMLLDGLVSLLQFTLGRSPASMANYSNSASPSARPAWARTWYARGIRRRKPGGPFLRITSRPWCRSTSSRFQGSGFRSCTCSWFWLTTEGDTLGKLRIRPGLGNPMPLMKEIYEKSVASVESIAGPEAVAPRR